MKRKKKGNKLSFLFSQTDFDLDVELGREYYKNDTKYLITLYRVDVVNSKTHKVYGQAKPRNKKLLPPVELSVWVNFSNEQTRWMSDGEIARSDIDSFIFNIYNKELDEKNIELNRGDYFSFDHGDRIRYYEIETINFVNSQSQTMVGHKPYYKRVVSKPVKEDVFLDLEK